MKRSLDSSPAMVRRLRARPSLWVTAWLALSCSPPPATSADAIVSDVGSNEVAALDAYEGRTLRVEGSVQRVGLKTRTQAELVEPGVARKTSRQVPFAVLIPDSAQGSIVCFFEDREDVMRLHEGDKALLEGTVYRVKKRGDSSLVYMDGCSVVE